MMIVQHFLLQFTAADAADKNADAPGTAEEAALIEEVNDPRELYNEKENESEAEEAQYDYDEELDHPGDVSISKKIWTFFTT